MQNDVNGLGWCLVDYFADAGVKYAAMGINTTRGLPVFDLPTPFWWESPSGKRIMALRADHYHTGNYWHIHDGSVATVEPGLLEYLESLTKRDYPFDRVSVQYSGYHTDNSPPAMKVCDLIRAWNEKYAWPRLRSAAASEFFEYVEKHHADDLAVHRKAWPDWWTDGFGSAAAETAASRATHVAVDASQTLLAMASLLGARPAPDLADRAAAIHENLLFYDEHTYGAAESITDPLAENTRVQWGGKAAYVWEAVKQAGMLREEALGALQPLVPRAAVPTIAVFNTLNWKRSGLIEVFIDHEILPPGRGYRIVDAQTGKAVRAQALRNRSEGTYWALWVEEVPALGYKSCRVEPGDPEPASPISAESGVIENAFYRLSVDPKTAGLTSIVDKQTGRELIDKQAERTCAQLFHEASTSGRDLRPETFQRTGLRNVKLRPGSAGPVWRSIAFTADMGGCAEPNGASGEIRLYEAEKRIEFHFAIRKLADVQPEAVYVAFPFALPGAEVLYEAQGGIMRPGRDQLPGTASDWQTVQSFLAVRGREGQIIWGSDQVPLVQLGGHKVGKWQPIAQVERPHVYSWVMNNYWFTNFRATQPGEFRWSYYLTSTSDTSNTAATRFGWGSRAPLIARVLPPGKATKAAPTASCLGVDAPNLVLVGARPAVDGDGVILHLREVDGKATSLALAVPSGDGKFKSIEEVNVLEEPLRSAPAELSFTPYEVKFVKLVRNP